ncbi:hypothetical protein XENORESO_008215, partial [Xenotaenia resolanae]
MASNLFSAAHFLPVICFVLHFFFVSSSLDSTFHCLSPLVDFLKSACLFPYPLHPSVTCSSCFCLTRVLFLQQMECDNFITVLQKVNDTFIVCGTNAGSPRCWMLVNDTVLTDVQGGGQIASASEISPPYPSQKSINLPADGSLYSAMSSVGGHGGSIRRTFGSQKLLKTENVWLLSPQFAGASIIPSSEKFKEEIYFFFTEFNKTARVDEEPYRARIGRICT